MANSLTDLFHDLTHAGVAVVVWESEALEKIGSAVEREAKRVIGTYDYDWPQLAELTQRERVRLGFTANDPLLRTGSLKESIEHTVIERERAVEIGTNHPIAPFQEFGTSRIPARSYLGGAAHAKEAEIAEEHGKGFFIAVEAALGLVSKV